MAYTLQDILGGGVPSGLLSPEQTAQTNRAAEAQGLLALGLNLLAGSRGMGQRPSTGQVLAQAGQAGIGAYQGAQKDAVARVLQEMQIADMVKKRQTQEQLQKLSQGLFQPKMGQVPTTIPTETYEDYKTTVPGVTGVELDRSMLPALGALGPEGMDYASKLMAFQKSMQPEERVMKPGEVLYRGGQEVMRVPETTPTGIREYTYAIENNLIPAGTTYTDFKKSGAMSIVMPSEGERKAAVLANRIQFNVNNIAEILGKNPSAASPEALAEGIKAITGSDYLKTISNTEDRQRIEAAQLDILDAALTLGTGAAYTREQLESYRRAYFPQLGEDPKTIADKQARLQNLLDSAFIASGRAAPTIGKKPEAAQPSVMRQPAPGNVNTDLNALIEAARREKANRSK